MFSRAYVLFCSDAVDGKHRSVSAVAPREPRKVRGSIYRVVVFTGLWRLRYSNPCRLSGALPCIRVAAASQPAPNRAAHRKAHHSPIIRYSSCSPQKPPARRLPSFKKQASKDVVVFLRTGCRFHLRSHARHGFPVVAPRPGIDKRRHVHGKITPQGGRVRLIHGAHPA